MTGRFYRQSHTSHSYIRRGFSYPGSQTTMGVMPSDLNEMKGQSLDIKIGGYTLEIYILEVEHQTLGEGRG